MTSFNRLYVDGLQRKLAREQASAEMEFTRKSEEIKELKSTPSISPLSRAVAVNLPQRPKKSEQFQLYSTEWQKLRDAKVEQARLAIEAEFESHRPKKNPNN